MPAQAGRRHALALQVEELPALVTAIGDDRQQDADGREQEADDGGGEQQGERAAGERIAA